ncbi:conserved hypothetical protein [Trichinella spiralis]|uniref:hypothetical protein n=1 Tax=Trichinella spiralis TaxID=6334 RepID=UPI0001EFD2DD|nr:conserved hypothetical protein [Trichinella spiralis]
MPKLITLNTNQPGNKQQQTNKSSTYLQSHPQRTMWANLGKYVSTCRSVRLIDYYGIYWAAAADSSVSVNGVAVVAAAIRGKSKSTLRRMDRPERCRINTSCESFFSFDNTAAGCRFLADQVEKEKKKQWKLEEQKDDDDTETLPRDDDDHQYYCSASSASPQSADGGCANCRLLRDKLVRTKRLLTEIDSTVRRLAEQHRVRADELTDARQRLRLENSVVVCPKINSHNIAPCCLCSFQTCVA